MKKPRICDILGVELEEQFNIKGISCNPCKVQDFTYYVVDRSGDVLHVKILLEAINNISLIEKIPKYTDEQKEIFKSLKVLGCNYIARDSDYDIYAYETKPEKCKYDWHSSDNLYIPLETYKILNQPHLNFINWEDEEPFKIPEV